jgi:uncharacterized membrane protein (DUF373 family)
MSLHEYDRASVRPLSTRAFEYVEHGLYIGLGFLLCATIMLALAGAASSLWLGLGDWTAANPVFVVIERLLVVLMLIEILHTVQVSVRSGTLTGEPFLVVGLIASIRRILVITLESSQAAQHGDVPDGGERLFRASMIEMGVLCVLIPVLVGSIYMLRRTRVGAPLIAASHRIPNEN